jgi:2-desacetyl-2-hydroxyethyl bacteriochlorophyllide A dehydrogenase
MPQRIVFPEKGRVELQPFELADIGPQDVRVRTQYSLMSIGTETIILHQRYDADTHFAKIFSFPQFKTGVQALGTVEACGPEAQEFARGDLVYMRAAHGSHQQLPGALLSHVPTDIDRKQACWAGLAKTAFRAAWAAQPGLGSDVLVIGAGPVGQMTTRWIAAAGARSITVADLAPARLEHARRGGAKAVLEGDIGDHRDAIAAIDQGNGPGVVIDTTGNPAAFKHALDAAARFGKIILLGDTGYPDRQHLTSDMMSKGLTVQATHDSHDRDGWDQRRVDAHFFSLVKSGRFNLDGLITHEFSPADCDKAYDLAETDRGNAMGILYDWTEIS